MCERTAFTEQLTRAYRSARSCRAAEVPVHARTLVGQDPDRIGEIISEVRRMLGTPRDREDAVATVRVLCHLERQGAALLFAHGRHGEALERERFVSRSTDTGGLEPTLVSLRSVARHAESAGLRHRVVREARTATFEAPEFFGRGPAGPSEEAALPRAVVAHLRDALVRGRSEAIGVSRERTLHDIVPLDLEGRWAHADFLHHDAGHAIEMRPKRGSTTTKARRGILLTGTCSDNYYHFLTEVLPRLALLDADPPAPDLPLLVDADMVAIPQLADLLARVSGGRPYRVIAKGAFVRVKQLVVPSAVTWMPPAT